MEIRVVNTEEKFVEAKEKWTNIFNRMEDATPFQSWEWNYAWWSEKREGELLIIEAFEGQSVFGYAPLVIKDRRIEFIGDVHFDYGQFVFCERKQEIFDLFWQKIIEIKKRKRLSIRLANIPIWSSQYSFFKNVSDNNKKTCFRELVNTAGVNLSEYGSFESYLKAIGKSIRKKAIRPCLKAGVSFEIEDYSDDVWQDVSSIYDNRQAQRIGYSRLDWAKPIVENLSKSGLLKICTLKYENQRVAFLIFFDIKNKLYIWLTAFDSIEKLRLGHFIRYSFIDFAYNQKKQAVDMMRGAYDYKKEWDCDVFYNFEFRCFGNRFSKRAYLFKVKLRKKLRDFVYNHSKVKSFYKKHSK